MNPASILALIGDLYLQIASLSEQNRALEEELARLSAPQ